MRKTIQKNVNFLQCYFCITERLKKKMDKYQKWNISLKIQKMGERGKNSREWC